MIVMVSNRSGIEVGLLAAQYPGRIGHLYSPGGQRGPWAEIPYALDNGAWPAFKNQRAWDETGWRELLLWASHSGIAPLWALVPDVVGDRAQTIDRYRQHVAAVRQFGFRPAFALQDGMTHDDVPDSDCMLFLGGSTEWKESAIRPWCAAFPRRVHVGRVNTWRRLVECWRAGAVSVDGTGWFRKGSSVPPRSGHRSTQSAELRKFLRETQAQYGRAA